MSQILKAWKKQGKINSSKEKPDNKESTNLSNNEPVPKNEATEEVEDEISEHLENLPTFCEQLESVIRNAHEVLQKAYGDEYPRNLRNRLKKDVNELICLQKEIKTISDNISSMKIQIAAVRLNLEAHKSKLKVLKSEERRTRFLLSTEANKYEKNLRNQRESSGATRYFLSSTGNGVSRATGTNTSASTRSTYISLPGISDSENSNKSTARTSSRSFIGPAKKPKHARHKKETQSDNGVTIYLRPINELDKSESSHSPNSRHSTPNTSIVNFSWLSAPEAHAQSDTATDSVISETNSLFVFSSDGHIEDVD